MLMTSYSYLVYFAGLTAGSVILVQHGRQRDRAPVVEDHTTNTDRLLTALSGLGMGILPLLYVATPCLSWADYQVPSWAALPGALVLSVGLWLLWRAHHDLGRYWSAGLQIRSGQPLVQEGIYASFRHPLYTGYILWGLAQPWLLHNYVAGLGMLVLFLPVYLYRVGREERMLSARYPEYAAYMADTPRLWPRPGRHRSRLREQISGQSP